MTDGAITAMRTKSIDSPCRDGSRKKANQITSHLKIFTQYVYMRNTTTIYDAPICHSDGHLQGICGIQWRDLEVYPKIIDLEKKMFERVMELEPSIAFIEGLYQGERFGKGEEIIGSNGTVMYELELSNEGIIVDGMENEKLHRMELSICDKYEKYGSELKHALETYESVRKSAFPIIKICAIYPVLSTIDNIISGARTFEMARYVLDSAKKYDTAVMIHGRGHNLKRMVSLLDRKAEVLPVDDSIEAEFTVCSKAMNAQIRKAMKDKCIVRD